MNILAILLLTCSVQVGKNTVTATYSAPFEKMDLTDLKDGTLFGTSYDGHLKLSLNDKVIYDGPAEGTNEEYGVIIENGRMTYANLNTGEMNMTFGRSFDDKEDIYWTDSTMKEIGGTDGIEPYSAKCSSPAFAVTSRIECRVTQVLDGGDFENINDFTFTDYPFVSFENQAADGQTLTVGAMSFSENDRSQPSKILVVKKDNSVEITAEPEDSGERYTLHVQGSNGTLKHSNSEATSIVAKLNCKTK